MSSINYKGYTARLEFSEGDGVFWGKVLGLPPSTSISFEGETVAQLTPDFHHAIDFYIADCAKHGKEALKPASGKLMLRVAPDGTVFQSTPGINAGRIMAATTPW